VIVIVIVTVLVVAIVTATATITVVPANLIACTRYDDERLIKGHVQLAHGRGVCTHEGIHAAHFAVVAIRVVEATAVSRTDGETGGGSGLE